MKFTLSPLNSGGLYACGFPSSIYNTVLMFAQNFWWVLSQMLSITKSLVHFLFYVKYAPARREFLLWPGVHLHFCSSVDLICKMVPLLWVSSSAQWISLTYSGLTGPCMNDDFWYLLLVKRSSLSKAEVTSLQDLMPDDLRWNWCNHKRNKVHNKCNVLESYWNHPPRTPGPWKNCLPQN